MSDELPFSSRSDASGLSAWWSRLFRSEEAEDRSRDRGQIAAFLGECRRRDLLDASEYAMLLGVLEVSKTQVRDIMIPRSHMVVLAHDDPPEVLLKTIVESGHSRFPVINGDRDQVIGILLAKDLLKFFGKPLAEREFSLEGLLRPAVFIPESKRLNTLLTEFRESHNHMALVVDEYGGVSGLATIEDVLEQIVGNIDDEHDPEEAEYIQSQGEGHFIVLALTRIEDFNEFFAAELSDEEYDTVGGLIMHELGRLPRRGEQVSIDGFTFKVLRGDRRRIHAVEVARLDQDA
jgi:magnesium and cobalt transporter